MAIEFTRLFSEGGGLETMQGDTTVRPGSPTPPDPVPWLPMAQNLALVEEGALNWQAAQALAMSEASHATEKYHELIERAREFLVLHGYEIGRAIDLLLNEKDRIRARFGITVWEAYWSILVRAFHEETSSFALAKALLSELDQDAA